MFSHSSVKALTGRLATEVAPWSYLSERKSVGSELRLDSIEVSGRTLSYALLARLTGLLALVSVVSAVTVSLRNSVNPCGIVVHHLAVPPEVVPNPTIAIIDHLHQVRGFGAFYWGQIYHIGYHFIILPDGTILRGRPERLRGAHALGYNEYLGICLVGDFSSRDNPDGRMGPTSPSEEQMRSLVKLTHDLQLKYRIPDARVVLHRELNSQTECPGDRFDKDSFLKRLALSSSHSRF